MLLLSALAFLLLVAGVLPLLAWLSKRKLDQGFVFPRLPFYAESIAVQILLLSISAAVAWLHRVPVPAAVTGRGILFGAVVLGVALVAMFASWAWSGTETRDRLLAIVPHTARERAAWALVSAVAATGEEVTYRAVLMTVLARMFEAWLPAALLASVIFALAHLVQGWKNAAVIAVFGFVFHLLVRSTGSLAPAIAVHFLYDLTTGLAIPLLSRRARQGSEAEVETFSRNDQSDDANL